MRNLLIGLLTAWLATNQAIAVSNVVERATNVSVTVPELSDPVEKEFKKLMEDDDAAEAEVDQLIQENQKFAEKGAGISQPEMKQRIHARLDPITRAYEDFIKRHPDHARARVAYASLLSDLGDEEGEFAQLEKANQLDPKIPSVWNNLGNYYSEHGPTEKVFESYEKAIALNSTEPVYFRNLATSVYLFRPSAGKYYHLSEQQVFDKALDLYARALKLDPTNFPLATDLAQSYYGIKPIRTEDALRAWTNALSITHDEVEREGVYIHLARFKMNAGRFDEARAHLNAVTNAAYAQLKERVAKNLDIREMQMKGTNNVSATVTNTVAAPTNAVPAAK